MTIHSEPLNANSYYDSADFVAANILPRKAAAKHHLTSTLSKNGAISHLDAAHQRLPSLDEHSTLALSSHSHVAPYKSGTKHERQLVHSEEMKAHSETALLAQFIAAHRELNSYINGAPIELTGSSLTIPAITAVARYGCEVSLDSSPAAHERIAASRQVIDDKLAENVSIYGVSTGFGGSADTRTGNFSALGLALLQHQHSGVLPVPQDKPFSKDHNTQQVSKDVKPRRTPLPLSPTLASLSMPIPWVRAAIVIRANSLLRGHSAVRYTLLERFASLLENHITPLVPLRGSISASGDLSPLSYVAGTVIGNPSIRCHVGLPDPHSITQEVDLLPAPEALKHAGLEPLALLPKEHLGILNGTAFSAALSSLLISDVTHLALLAQALTAFGVEALRGSTGSFDPFIHDVCRPHPGQVEVAKNVRTLHQGSLLVVHEEGEKEKTVEEDKGVLRQDRYPLRTSPQWVGPQVDEILHAWDVITTECNSTTDNPLIDAKTNTIHHGGNFQAMALTTVMESSRLALHQLSYILFTQLTELINPTMNRGLPPNLAFTDPSLNFAAKGIDIGCAAYVSESGWAAGHVATHVKSAEMHNQAVNSLALISARATEKVAELNGLVAASYLWALCQAVDLRAMMREFKVGAHKILRDALAKYFGLKTEALPHHVDDESHFHHEQEEAAALVSECWAVMEDALDCSSTMDALPRMEKVARATLSSVSLYLSSLAPAPTSASQLAKLPGFLGALSAALGKLLLALQRAYLTGERGPAPAAALLGRTRALYEFVRVELGVPAHGRENLELFGQHDEDGEFAPGESEETLGGAVSRIYEAIRDGRMQAVIVGMFDCPESSSA